MLFKVLLCILVVLLMMIMKLQLRFENSISNFISYHTTVQRRKNENKCILNYIN
jgi:hypothetical protein